MAQTILTDFFSKYQTIIVGVIVIVAGFFAYTYFFTDPAPAALSASGANQNATADQDLITLLSTLHTIKLDDGIFADPAFQSLKDFSTALVPEPIGRTNPFSPLSGTPTAPKAPGK